MIDLPPILAEDDRVYLRPIGLSVGVAAERLIAAGEAWRLAGGPFAFGACEVICRTEAGIQRYVAKRADLEWWQLVVNDPWPARIAVQLEHLATPRLAPDGAGLNRPLIMGIVNVTPDSFSDGGEFLERDQALRHARRLVEDGADILDVGGESTRPGATPVKPDAESRRVAPVLGQLRGEPALRKVFLSVDTRHAAVMKEALAEGVEIINDITALTGDAESADTVAQSKATAVLMHMQGEPGTMNENPVYEDAALDVFDFLEARVESCIAAGIPRERLIVDPGIGFGKSGQHNLAILRSLSLYHGIGCPVLIGVSRKGLTGALDRARPPSERLSGSLAAALHALNNGVQVLRVHDVAETRQALDVWERLAGWIA